MVAEAALAVVVGADPQLVQRLAVAVGEAEPGEGGVEHLGVAEPQLQRAHAARLDGAAQGLELVVARRDLPAALFEQGLVVHDAAHLRGARQVVQLAVAGEVVQHGEVVAVREPHARQIEQLVLPVLFADLVGPGHDHVGNVVVREARLVLGRAHVAGVVAHLHDVDIGEPLLHGPLEAVDGEGVLHEHRHPLPPVLRRLLGQHVLLRPLAVRRARRQRQRERARQRGGQEAAQPAARAPAHGRTSFPNARRSKSATGIGLANT